MSTSIYKKFDQAILWNCCLFFLNNFSKSIISLILYYKLSADDFSAWANVLSIVFVLALWLDFGFRKSIPLFLPAYELLNRSGEFIRRVIVFKLLVSILATIGILLFTNQLSSILNLAIYSKYFYLGSLIFICENVRSIFRIIFQSNFWQKQLAVIESMALVVQLVGVIFFTLRYPQTKQLLRTIFLLELLSQLIIIILGGITCLTYNQSKHVNKNISPYETSFLKHSGIMWMLISINSLTERNFLIPLITYYFSPSQAAIFKVANDCALALQRFVVKAIGSTDTSFLASINLTNKEKLNKGMVKLTKKLCTLTIPLFGIIVLAWMQPVDLLFKNKDIYYIFFILSIFYLLQLLFLGYDRLLEVNRNYKELIISFIPYSTLFIGCIYISSRYGLISFVIFIQLLRFSSTTLRIYFSTLYYKIKFPIKFALKLLTLTLISTLVICIIAKNFVNKKSTIAAARLLFPL